MMKKQFLRTVVFAGVASGYLVAAPAQKETTNSFSLTLKQAEEIALNSSDELKSIQSAAESTSENAEAQFSALYPKLSLDANYRYLTNVPKFSLPFPGATPIPFGTHDNYTVGPTLSYVLWDTGTSRNAYNSLDLLSRARREDKKNAENQILLGIRSTYLKLQLALEELRLLNNSLALAKKQNQDIEANYKGGAASKLDRVDSKREYLNYQLQFQQKQSEVASDFKDLLALLKRDTPTHMDTQIHLDSLEESISKTTTWKFAPPTDQQPQVRSQRFLAESSDRAALSIKDAGFFPTVIVSANASLQHPNAIKDETIEQNTFAVGVSLPLFEGNRTHHLMAQKKKEAEAARFSEAQLKTNLSRDYNKAIEELENLREQQKLASEDVQHSEEAAKLYYQSYRSGRLNLIDVQSANNRALTSKVNAARINAQILSHLFNLEAITGEAATYAR